MISHYLISKQRGQSKGHLLPAASKERGECLAFPHTALLQEFIWSCACYWFCYCTLNAWSIHNIQAALITFCFVVCIITLLFWPVESEEVYYKRPGKRPCLVTSWLLWDILLRSEHMDLAKHLHSGSTSPITSPFISIQFSFFILL